MKYNIIFSHRDGVYMSYFQEANNLYNTKDYRKAITLYQKAAESKDNEAAALYNAAVCFIKLREFEKSVALLKSAIDKKIESKYFFNLGYCYTMLKDNRKGLIYFNTAWALDNNDNDCEKAINLIIQKHKK